MEIIEYAFLKEMAAQRTRFTNIKKMLYDYSDSGIHDILKDEKIVLQEVFDKIKNNYSFTREEVDSYIKNNTLRQNDFYLLYLDRKKEFNNKLNSHTFKEINKKYGSDSKKIIKHITEHKSDILLDNLSEYNLLNIGLINELIKKRIMTGKEYGKDVAPVILYRFINRGQVEEARLLFDEMKYDKEMLRETLYCIGHLFENNNIKVSRFLSSLSTHNLEILHGQSENLLTEKEKDFNEKVWSFFQKHKLKFEKMNLQVSPFENSCVINAIKIMHTDLQRKKLSSDIDLVRIKSPAIKKRI